MSGFVYNMWQSVSASLFYDDFNCKEKILTINLEQNSNQNIIFAHINLYEGGIQCGKIHILPHTFKFRKKTKSLLFSRVLMLAPWWCCTTSQWLTLVSAPIDHDMWECDMRHLTPASLTCDHHHSRDNHYLLWVC